jgi:hypothetical protein
MLEPRHEYQILPGELAFLLPLHEGDAMISCVVQGPERVHLKVDRSTLLQAFSALKKHIERQNILAPEE